MSFSQRIAEAVVRAAETMAERGARPTSSTVAAVYAGTDTQGAHRVLLPGSDESVPVSSMAVEATVGDTVSVTISEGATACTANLSNPSAGVDGVTAASEQARAAAEATGRLAAETEASTTRISKIAAAAGRKAAAAAQDAEDAAKVARNYLFTATDGDAWVHAEDAGPNTQGEPMPTTYGWRIGRTFEMVRAGASYMKMWVESNVAKLRLGLDTAGHAIFSPDGMEVFTDASTSVAEFGSTARIGEDGKQRVEITDSGVDIYEPGGTLAQRMRAAGNKMYVAGTEVASFAASLVEIGKNSANAVISLCNGKGTIEYNADSSASSSEDYSSTSYFEVKGADLRLNGTSRAALYSYYTNGSNIGRKTSVITKPAELKMFSESSSNLSSGVGTWAMSVIDMTPNGITAEANSNGSGTISATAANNMTLTSTAGTLRLVTTVGALRLSGAKYTVDTPNAFARAIGLAKTKGDTITFTNVDAVGYLSNARKSASLTVYFPYLVYGLSSNTSCTLSGNFYARQNNGYCFGSTASSTAALSSLTVSIQRIQSGYCSFTATGAEQTAAINNDPIAFRFSSLTITLT